MYSNMDSSDTTVNDFDDVDELSEEELEAEFKRRFTKIFNGHNIINSAMFMLLAMLPYVAYTRTGGGLLWIGLTVFTIGAMVGQIHALRNGHPIVQY